MNTCFTKTLNFLVNTFQKKSEDKKPDFNQNAADLEPAFKEPAFKASKLSSNENIEQHEVINHVEQLGNNIVADFAIEKPAIPLNKKATPHPAPAAQQKKQFTRPPIPQRPLPQRPLPQRPIAQPPIAQAPIIPQAPIAQPLPPSILISKDPMLSLEDQQTVEEKKQDSFNQEAAKEAALIITNEKNVQEEVKEETKTIDTSDMISYLSKSLLNYRNAFNGVNEENDDAINGENEESHDEESNLSNEFSKTPSTIEAVPYKRESYVKPEIETDVKSLKPQTKSLLGEIENFSAARLKKVVNKKSNDKTPSIISNLREVSNNFQALAAQKMVEENSLLSDIDNNFDD